MTITLTNAGVFSHIQDGGRFGFMESGFSPGGAMDSAAAMCANLLAGNDAKDAVIEMTLCGIGAVFEDDRYIAVCGAEFPIKINGAVIANPQNRAIKVLAGQELEIGFCSYGMRAWLAIEGGFDIAPVLNSVSTNFKCKLGGFHGRSLENGDVLPLRTTAPSAIRAHNRAFAYPQFSDQGAVVRAILGPQDSLFTKEAVKAFFNTTYRLTPKCDRMGLKLNGASLFTHKTSDIISDGVVCGSVQVPSNGQPIVLLSDCQTTGGYAKIATLITPDIRKCAQLKPGASLRFKAVTVEEAQGIYRAYMAGIGRMRRILTERDLNDADNTIDTI